MARDDDALRAFAETAASAVAACGELAPRARAERLAADGLLGVLAPEEAGGLGLDAAFAIPVMAAAGAGLLGFPLLETLLLGAALGQDPAGKEIVFGERIGTIAWSGTAALSGSMLRGAVGRAPMAEDADLLLVATGEGAALVALDGPGITIAEAVGLDVDVPESEVVLHDAPAVARIGIHGLARLREEALVLWAAAIQGAADSCLSLAVDHTGTREQFGRALVNFQVLRHALARQKLAVEHIRAALTRYVTLVAEGAPEARLARHAAFAAATRFGAAAVENALQLHGGMGFTWDLPLHRHLRRIRAWEAQGNAVAVHRGLADELLRANA